MSEKETKIPLYLSELEGIPLKKILEKTRNRNFENRICYSRDKNSNKLRFLANLIIYNKELLSYLDEVEDFILNYGIVSYPNFSRIIIDFLDSSKRWNTNSKFLLINMKSAQTINKIEQSVELRNYLTNSVPIRERFSISQPISIYFLLKESLDISLNVFDSFFNEYKVENASDYFNLLLEKAKTNQDKEKIHDKLIQVLFKNKISPFFYQSLLGLKKDKNSHLKLFLSKTNNFHSVPFFSTYVNDFSEKELNILLYRFSRKLRERIIPTFLETGWFTKDRCFSFLDYILNNYKNVDNYLKKEFYYTTDGFSGKQQKELFNEMKIYLINRLKERNLISEIAEIIMPKSFISMDIQTKDQDQEVLATATMILFENNFFKNYKNERMISKLNIKFFNKKYLSFLTEENIKDTHFIEQRPDIAKGDLLYEYIKQFGKLSSIRNSLNILKYNKNIGGTFWIKIYNLKEEDFSNPLYWKHCANEIHQTKAFAESMIKEYSVSDIIMDQIDD